MVVFSLVVVGLGFPVCLFYWFVQMMGVSLGSELLLAGLGWGWVIVNVLSLVVDGVGSMCYGLIMISSVSLWGVGVVGVVCCGGVVSYMAHFSLLGLSGVLSLVLPSIELISVGLRPVTLGVRLATNISSGHVLLGLLGLVLGGSSVWVVLVFGGLFLVLLEVFVGVLQGGIYSTLVVLYTKI